MHRIIRYTVGWWYDNNDAVKNVRQYMIRYAVGEILDAFAEQYGFTREEGESDESLRNRLLAHFRELFRKDYVTNNNNMKIYTKLQHGNPHENLTSTNTYLSNDYYIYAPDKIRDYWSNKYITWRDIIWL